MNFIFTLSSFHQLKVDVFFFLVKEMQRSSIYFGSEYNLDNLYWCTDCRVLAAA